MATNQMTIEPTESDLEARIRAAVKTAFPWAADHSIKHQIKFSFKFGRTELETKQGKEPHNEARLDILLCKGASNLAVLELKRPGNALTVEDERQGLSYARLVQPQAPLVIVTNGLETKLIKTFDGQEWSPGTPTEQAFYALVRNAGTVADADLKQAIDALMGTSSSVWVKAVRAVTKSTVKQLTSTEEMPGLPFLADLMLPRGVTKVLEEQLLGGQRLAMLVGAPLAGKSNVLRELSGRLEKSEDAAVLYLEAGSGLGALQTLADALADSLDWPVSVDEARNWLARVSNSGGERLILAFDGFDSQRAEVIREIEDLTSNRFGTSLSIVLALDESSVKRVTYAPNQVSLSILGRRAKVLEITSLDDSEFQAVAEVLAAQRVGLMPGADKSPEYREPWILRAAFESTRNVRATGASVTLMPFLGLDVISMARWRFKEKDRLRRCFRHLAAAFLVDARDSSRSDELKLQQLGKFLVRHDTAAKKLAHEDLLFLTEYGFVKNVMTDSYGATLQIRLPELLASEGAFLLTDDLLNRAKEDIKGAALWIANAAGGIPLGELVLAQALLDTFRSPKSALRAGILTELLEFKPTLEPFESGSEYIALHPDVGMIAISPGVDGKTTVEAAGLSYSVDAAEEGLAEFKNVPPWLVLSHIASFPSELDFGTSPEQANCDLLLQVGMSKIPLVPSRDPENMRVLPQRDLPDGTVLLDKDLGIVEPITLGILNYLAKEPDASIEDFVARATASESIALLERLNTALIALTNVGSVARREWAEITIRDRLLPAVSAAFKRIDYTLARQRR